MIPERNKHIPGAIYSLVISDGYEKLSQNSYNNLFNTMSSNIPSTLANTWVLAESTNALRNVQEEKILTNFMGPYSDAFRGRLKNSDCVYGAWTLIECNENTDQTLTKGGFGLSPHRGGMKLTPFLATHLTFQDYYLHCHQK